MLTATAVLDGLVKQGVEVRSRVGTKQEQTYWGGRGWASWEFLELSYGALKWNIVKTTSCTNSAMMFCILAPRTTNTLDAAMMEYYRLEDICILDLVLA